MVDRLVAVGDDLTLPSAVVVPQGRVTNLKPTGADQAAAIQAVLDAAGSDDTVRLQGAYTIGSTITVVKNLDASGAVFNYTGTGTAVVVGDTAGATFRKRVHLPRVVFTNKPGTGWTASTVGVKVTNAYSYEVIAPHITGFEVGLLVYGESSNGTSYTLFNLGQLDNNKVNLKLDAAATGWANQNVFLNGRYSHNSGEGTQVSGTRHVQVASTTNIVNGNLFVGPSIESPNVVEYHIEMFGQYNLFLNARLENTGGDASRRIWSRGTAKGNRIIGGFNTGQLTQVKEASAFPFDVDSDVQRSIRGGASGVATLLLENMFSSTHPTVTIMESGAAAAGSAPETAYAWRITAQQMAGKRAADSFNRFVMDGLNGRIYVGNATAAPDAYWTGSPASMILGGASLYFLTDNAFDIGSASSLRPRYIRAATAVRTGAFATGSRPAAATAGAGAMVFDTTLGKPVFSNGTNWVDATGTVV